ncbi:uncharacterized protein [Elaeis guineensis]|uniref:Uncharacterized protein LOC105044412 n=1 Tax=Elaeis guineensis var. tenera TaxID=51953 RepID=A0A6I9R4Q7_ELAGV|nr:uncharacterized protein LOC105044412 [Elaeis guineensis]
MAKLLQRQNSDLAYQKKCSGCLWGFRQFFDFHQRLRIRKMLTDRNHGDGKSYAGIETPKSLVPSTVKKHDIVKSETNILIGNKGNTTKRRRSKGHMRALFFKTLARKQNEKWKTSPVTRQLLRTISIHHLECDDYVLHDEVTSDNEPSTIELSPHESDSSAASKHVPLSPSGSDGPIFGKMSECRAMNTVNHVDDNLVYELGDHSVEKQGRLVEKINGANESLSKQKHVDAKRLGRDAVIQSSFFINSLELFRTDRDLFIKLLEDQNFVQENFLWCRHSSSTKKLLTHSSSFPRAGLSGGKAGPSRRNHKWKESELFVNQEKKSQLGNTPSISSTMSKGAMTSKAGIKVDILKSEFATMDASVVGSSSEVLPGSTHELKSQRDHGTVLNHFKDLQQRTENVVNKNRKANHRISMDGILHKVPYGQKVTEDVMKEKLCRSASAGYDRDNPRDNIGISANRYLHQSIQRSRSLTESLDRYSHLLESISTKESKRLPESLKSSNEDGGLQHRKTLKTSARIFSNPEFLSSHSFSEDVQSEVFCAALSSEVSATSFLDSDVAVNIHSFLGPESVGTLVHAKQIKESDTTEHSIDINVSGITDESLECPLLTNEHDQSDIGKVSYPTDQDDICHMPLHERDIGISTQPKLISEHDHKEIQEISSVTYTPLLEQESGMEMDPTDKQIPVSVLDSFLEEDPVTSAKCLISADPELEPRSLHFKEPDDSRTLENPLDAEVFSQAEIIEPSSGKIQTKGLTHVDAFHIQVDKEDEAEFNYVRDVLNKSGFIGEFLGTWYSPYLQLDPLRLGEVDGLPHEFDIATYNHDMSPDNELLFDLINEVLLEIYETSFASTPWLSCFGSQRRPMFGVCNILKEVWTKISWRLSLQKQLNYTLQSIVARDFAKNDGWLNLQWDAECVGIGLEDLILANLLDELILEFDDTSYPQFVSS